MESIETLYKTLENKILILLRRNKELNDKIVDLEGEVVFFKQKLSEQRILNEELKDKNEVLKIASAVGGNKEHRRLMKNKVNSLIKEIDTCIQLMDYTDR